jgi:dUTP pyrophosphatase
MKIMPLVKEFIKPEYKTEYSAGMDIYLQEDATLIIGADNVIHLGFAAEVPEGYAAILLPRSSAGMKGISLRNTAGVIDSDYRGEWIAHIVIDQNQDNALLDEWHYKRGDRIIQCLIVPVKKVDIELTESVSVTARGNGGFGSTGK